MKNTTQQPTTSSSTQNLTKAEAYFVKVAGIDPTELIACGYLTTVIRYGSKGQTMGDALNARSSFVGLTQNMLYLVETRAPATSSPLLENKGIRQIPREEIRDIELNGERIRIITARGDLDFGTKLKNRHFPSQERLVEAFFEMSSAPLSLDDLRNMIRRNTLRKWTPFIIVAIISLAALLYRLVTG